MKKNKTVDDDWIYSFLVICLIGIVAILIQAYKTEGSSLVPKDRQRSIVKTNQPQLYLAELFHYLFEQIENNH